MMLVQQNKWFPFCLEKMDISPNVVRLDISHDLWEVCDDKWAEERLEKNGKAEDEKTSEKGSTMADWKKKIEKEKAQNRGSSAEKVHSKAVKER